MNTVLQDALATLFGFTLITFHQLKLYCGTKQNLTPTKWIKITERKTSFTYCIQRSVVHGRLAR